MNKKLHILLFSLLIFIGGCNQKKDFLIDKYAIIDIANSQGSKTPYIINRKQFDRISIPKDFYHATAEAYEKGDFSLHLYDSDYTIKPDIEGSNYVFKIGDMPDDKYIILYDFEYYGPGGHTNVEIEIELK